MAIVAALIPWLALAPWMTRFGVGRTASGQVYGLWPGRLFSRDVLRCIAVVTRKRSQTSHYHRYRPCDNHELQSSRSVLRGLGSRVSAARFVWGWLVPPAAPAFVEALKTPVDLVLDANIGIHVIFFLATVCTGNRAGSSDGYLPYPYLDSR